MQIKAPDGSLVEFPEGTPDETIVSVMQKNYPAQEQPNKTEDIAKSFAFSGLPKAAAGLVGMPGDIQALGDLAGKWIREKTRGPVTPEQEAFLKSRSTMPTTADVTKGIENITGSLYQPKTPEGKISERIGSYGLGALFPGSALQRIGAQWLGPAIGSMVGEHFTKNTPYAPYGELAGAMAGSFIPSSAMRAVTPIPASAERRAAEATLKEHGVTDLTAGEKTGSKALRYMESTLGDAPFAGGKATLAQDAVERQFTKAAMDKMGIQSEIAMPKVIEEGKQKIVKNFNDLSARNTLSIDKELHTALDKSAAEYSTVLQPFQNDIINKVISSIKSYGPDMPGVDYQKARSILGRIAEAKKTNEPELAGPLKAIQTALDDAMGRSISPADKTAWDTARKQYSAYKTIDEVSRAAGEKTALGQIIPGALRRVAERQGNVPDLAELGRAGAAVMTPMPNSGTADRRWIQTFLSGLGALGAHEVIGGPNITMGAALAGLAAPSVAGKALMTRPVQAYLGNQLFANQQMKMDPKKAAMIQMLLSAGR